jgi:hypothetical protein
LTISRLFEIVTMSDVRFKQESISEKIQEGIQDLGSRSGRHELAHEVGAALTKGGGPNGYLAVSWCN